MARIAGVDLPKNKRVEIGLCYIYGIGRMLSNKILRETSINPDTKVKDLTEAEIVRLREAVDKYEVEGDLRHEIASNIKRLMEIGCYRGQRHRKGLPCRGQRTKTNARTRKGKRSIVPIKRKAAVVTGSAAAPAGVAAPVAKPAAKEGGESKK